MKYYTGIGSRSTPKNILDMMSQIGEYMAHGEYCLLSGGASGADTAFESGCDTVKGKKQIFLPWNGFQNRIIDDESIFNGVDTKAMDIAEKFHPKWSMVGKAARALMARNTYQVLSTAFLSPKSDLLICWTPDGSIGKTTFKTGGTGQAIRIAYHHKIKIWNLQRQDHINKIMTNVNNHLNKRK